MVDYDPALCTMYKVTKPDLELVWTLYADRDIETECEVTGIYACDDVFIAYKVVNTGTGTTEPVVLTHNLPEGLTTADGKQMVKLEMAPLAAGKSKSVKVPLTLAEDAAGQDLDLSAEANAGGITANTDVKTVSVLKPDLDLRIDGRNEQYLGRESEMTFTVTNNSDALVTNAYVTVDDADRFNFNTRALDGDNVIIGCLRPGQSRTFRATYAADQPGEVAVVARAAAYCVDAVEKTLTTNYKGISAILIETVDKVDPVPVGQNTTYEIYVKNQGSAPDLDIQLTGMLPDGLTFVSATGDSDVKANGQNLSFGKIAELAPGDVASWNVVVKAESPGKVKFKLNLKSDANPDAVEEEEPTTLY